MMKQIHKAFTAPEKALYHRCVSRIKLMAKLPMPKSITLKESVRQNQFAEAIEEAMHCELFDFWPLRAQCAFLGTLDGLTVEYRDVLAHEQAYQLLKMKKAAARGQNV